jgi:hypothetical protein
MYIIKNNKGYITLDRKNNITITTNLKNAKKFEDNLAAENFIKSVCKSMIKDISIIFVNNSLKVKRDKKIDKLNDNKLFNKYGYRTINNHPQMGLDNIICKTPVAFCKYKDVWLNEHQIAKCINKKDIYGYEYKQCYYLIKD